MNQTLRILGLLILAASTAWADSGDPDLVGTVVDESGHAVAGATVRATLRNQPIEVKTESDGSFRLVLPVYPQAEGRVWGSIEASSPDGRLGLIALHQLSGKREPVKLVLKPARELTVVVVDRDGKPVDGADVDFLNGMSPFLAGRCNAEGRWSARVPADATAWSIIARKGGVGFDYATGDRANGSDAPQLALPPELKLTLDGAKLVRVKVVDPSGQPLAGVNVGPWTFQKPDREADVNLGGMMKRWPVTGADGRVTFDWWPDLAKRQGSLLVGLDGYFALEHSTQISDAKPGEELTITLYPMERLSGRVTDLDGKPASGVKIMLQGQGSGSNTFHGTTLTDADGRYELKVYSEQAYVVTATRGDLAAPYRADVVVRAGKPKEGVDLALVKATKVRGRVTVGKDDRPEPNVYVTLVISKGQIPREIKQAGDRFWREVSLRTSTETDASGRYEFQVGPGDYQIIGPARIEPTKFTIPAQNPPAELVENLKMPRPEAGPLAVTVVDPQGQPVSGATVDGMYAAFQARRWFYRQKTDEKGKFRIERSLDPLVLHASSADGKLGGLLRSEAEATEARIVVGPLATATGRLFDSLGKPVTKRKLNFAIQVHMSEEPNSPWSDCFGGSAETDDQGRFTLTGLVPNHEYSLTLPTGDDGSSRNVTNVTANGPGPFDLGDVSVDTQPYRPYVPPTAKERTAEAFAARAKTSPKERLSAMLPEAKREYTRPLLLFGKADDPACVELFRLFNERAAETEDDEKPDAVKTPKPPTPADLRWEFELMSLDTTQADVRPFANEFGTEVGEGQPPVLVVLDADGKVRANDPLKLNDAQKLDGPALAKFLTEHKLATRDAEKMLADALIQAKAEDKRVFLIASASWCGPCRLLARFLFPRKADFEPHFVFVKLDISRDLHAQTLLERFPESASSGVPWYVILDGDGKPLITSCMPSKKSREGSTNIGFPSSLSGVDHFLNMLKQTAPRLTAEKIEELRKALLKK